MRALRSASAVGLALALALVSAAPLRAQVPLCPGLVRPLIAYNFETVTVSTVAVGFTTATMTTGGTPALARVSVEAQSLRYRDDGTDPTSAVGHQSDAGAVFYVCGPSLFKLKMIRLGGTDSTVRATYYRLN